MRKLKILQNKTFKIISIIVLALLCLILLLSIIFTIKYLHERGELEPDYILDKQESQELNRRVKIDDIEEWMTFDYLDVVFNLDPNYLKNSLAISDPKYPNIRIDSYAKNLGIEPELFLQQIKQDIINYNDVK